MAAIEADDPAWPSLSRRGGAGDLAQQADRGGGEVRADLLGGTAGPLGQSSEPGLRRRR